jgi:TIR domain
MKKLFISYGREDQDSAEKLYKRLKSLSDVQVWYDQVHLLPGVSWRPAIRKAIRESDYFLALLSTSSVKRRGYVQKERKDALSILDEFPEDQPYLIPIRLDECDLPSEKLGEIQYVDLFRDWNRGIEKILSTINSQPERLRSSGGALLPGPYRYRCGIVDLDNGLTNLPEVCALLNSTQKFFHFTHPSITLRNKRPRSFEGSLNFDIDVLPQSFFDEKHEYLNVDLLACLTKYLLAGTDDDLGRFWNYFSAPTQRDGTIHVVSTHELYESGKQARCSFEKAVVYNIVSQLIVYFASDVGFHDEVRGCIMDFCEERSVMVKGLKRMRLCASCSRSLKNKELRSAVQTILQAEI